MKTIFALFSLLFVQIAFAKITDSNYEARHLKLIDQAIKVECGYFYKIKQIDSKEEIIQVDQGIRDVIYTTKLEGTDRIDQGVFDLYEISVVSEYADMYDHASRDWGVYSVKSVQCEML